MWRPEIMQLLKPGSRLASTRRHQFDISPWHQLASGFFPLIGREDVKLGFGFITPCCKRLSQYVQRCVPPYCIQESYHSTHPAFALSFMKSATLSPTPYAGNCLKAREEKSASVLSCRKRPKWRDRLALAGRFDRSVAWWPQVSRDLSMN